MAFPRGYWQVLVPRNVNMIWRIIQPFYTAFVLATFIVCLLIAFPIIFLIGIGDKPFAREVIWYIVHYWSIIWLWIIGMPVRVMGKKPTSHSKYIVVANHISYMDTIAIYAAIPEYFRTLAKKEMSKIPVFGFVYKQLAILVDRSSTDSRSKSMRLMWRVLKNESNIMIFPEGTFNETGAPLKDFYDGAFRLAISAQVSVVPLIFLDTVNRWHYSGWWKLSPGKNRAVFLDPVPTEGLAMKDLPVFKQRVFSLMHSELLKHR